MIQTRNARLRAFFDNKSVYIEHPNDNRLCLHRTAD